MSLSRTTRSWVAALAVTACAGAGSAVVAAPAQATTAPVARIVVTPGGSDSLGTLTRAQHLARTLSQRSDVAVELAGGTYHLSAPLTFTAADSGHNGHTITWQALPGQTPVLSGGQSVTGWTLHDPTANVYVAKVPKGLDSRQVYVNGALAPRAAITIARSDVKVTATGLTIVNPALNYLASLLPPVRRWHPTAGELVLVPPIRTVVPRSAGRAALLPGARGHDAGTQ